MKKRSPTRSEKGPRPDLLKNKLSLLFLLGLLGRFTVKLLIVRLGFFLGAFTVPMGSNSTERSHYIVFIQRLEAAGALKQGAAPGILAALRSSLSE